LVALRQRICGVDYDSHRITLVVINKKWQYQKIIEIVASEKEFSERFEELTNSLFDSSEVLDLTNNVKFIIEDSIYTRNPRATLDLAQIKGMLITFCLNNGIKYQIMPARSWKKIVLKNGGVKKEEVAEFILKKHPELKKRTQHVFDAYCIAISGN